MSLKNLQVLFKNADKRQDDKTTFGLPIDSPSENYQALKSLIVHFTKIIRINLFLIPLYTKSSFIF